MAEKIGIYFMGAGLIAVPILRKIAAEPGFELRGVATQPDRMAGRGKRPTPTPVGKAAAELGLAVDKPVSVNTPEFLEKIGALAVDLLLVVSFGQILREGLLSLPGTICVNVHASLLPKYRGASPVVSAIRNRDEYTGVAFMKMERGLDTGPVYDMERLRLDGSEYAEELELKLGEMAAARCPAVLPAIVSGNRIPVPQDEAQVSVCRKIRKADGRIDWTKPAAAIEAEVRAYCPWPGATFAATVDGRAIDITVHAARVRIDAGGVPGGVLRCDRHGWIVACGTGALELVKVSAPGKKVMGSADFLNGFRGATWRMVKQ